MAVERQDLYRYAHFRIDFGLNEAQQDVQSEIPELVQYDNQSGMFVFDFFNLGRRVDTAGYSIVLNFLLPNGDFITRMVEDKNRQASRAIFYTPNSILLVPGIVQGTVSLYNAEKIQVTSPVRFKFRVQEGIENETGNDSVEVPVLQQLIADVQALKEDVAEWEEALEQEHEKQKEEFTEMLEAREEQLITVAESWDTVYENSLAQKEADYDRFLGQNNTEFQEQLEEQQEEFQGLVEQFNEAFNGFDMGGAFEQKFENLEEEYAEQYAETKRITQEIYTTTLTYRYVDEEENE